MSADEIRMIAEPLCRDRAVSVYNKSLDEFVADGCITLKYRDALLAYAAMVERCEEVLNAKIFRFSNIWDLTNYILKGSTDEY